MRLTPSILAAALIAVPLAAAPAQVTQVASAAASASAPDPLRDQAIAELEAFLAKYPNSALRPNALFELGELLVQRADDRFAETQRASAGDTTARPETPIKPDYGEAIRRYDELVRRYPNFDRFDAAAYTLGTLYAFEQRWADAARAFESVVAKENSTFRSEALFRLGDAHFETAAKQSGATRRATFARAAQAYEQATAVAPRDGDIYFLALYKLGWSYYNQASRTGQEEYNKAVDVFGRLVEAYDKLTPQQQARLGLRAEAIEYMAVAFTQVGGAEAANRWFAQHPGTPYRLQVMQRVAAGLGEQGDFPRAIAAYRQLIAENATDSSALSAQREIVDIFQNRMIEADSAQAARLELVERFGPGSEWARANPGLADTARVAREAALRQSAQFLLAQAQRTRNREQYARSAQLYERYLNEFGEADSARVAAVYMGEALLGTGQFAAAGAAFARGGQGDTTKFGHDALRSAIVAYDSAIVLNKTDRAAQDAFFQAVDAFVAANPNSDVAKQALIQKGKRASETQRWDVMAETFRQYAQRWPNDPYTPTAQRLIGDALFKGGAYAEAQTQWESAEQIARTAGRTRLADSIAAIRRTAVDQFADTLIRQGRYENAAEDVYITFAEKNPQSEQAPDALRNAIEAYLAADTAFRRQGDDRGSERVREKAVRTVNLLAERYPNYRYTNQYQQRAVNVLIGLGKHEEAAEQLRKLIANPGWSGRADAMVQLAVTLDSADKAMDAARAYEDFASAYPRDRRASDALWNAGITYREAGDREAEARVMAAVLSRYGSTARGDSAAARRIVLLREMGDSTTADQEFTRLCARSGNKEAVREACAGRMAEIRKTRAAEQFRSIIAQWDDYKEIRFEFTSKAQLNAAGVRRAQSRKEQSARRLVSQLQQVARSGDPEMASAAAFTIGLVSWEFAKFLEDVRLPEGLADEERQAAVTGARENLAPPHYAEAREAWQGLVNEAKEKDFDNAWVQRARDALEGNVPDTPPTAMARHAEPMVAIGGGR